MSTDQSASLQQHPSSNEDNYRYYDRNEHHKILWRPLLCTLSGTGLAMFARRHYQRQSRAHLSYWLGTGSWHCLVAQLLSGANVYASQPRPNEEAFTVARFSARLILTSFVFCFTASLSPSGYNFSLVHLIFFYL